jgi:hypothetical protein
MNLSRRELLRNGLGMLVAAPVGLSAITALAQAPKAGALTLVDPTKDPLSKALGYVHNAADAKAERKDKAIGGKTHKADTQLCSNCALYVKTGAIEGAEVGKCTMIAAGMVKAGGWCKSWSPKA